MKFFHAPFQPHIHTALQEEFSSITSLFLFVYGLMNNKDLVKSIWESYTKLRAQKDSAYNQYVPLYLALEGFIAQNKPPIIKHEYTKESLRKDAR